MSGIEACFRIDWPGFTLDVDLVLPKRGVTALFGHSGSGKTTLRRALNRLKLRRLKQKTPVSSKGLTPNRRNGKGC